MREQIPYVIYLIPFLVTGSVESLIQICELDESRSQLYVPLLAIFPFIYLLQGTLISQYGGSIILAGIMTAIVFLSTACVFLNFITVYALGIICLTAFFVIFIGTLFTHCKRK